MNLSLLKNFLARVPSNEICFLFHNCSMRGKKSGGKKSISPELFLTKISRASFAVKKKSVQIKRSEFSLSVSFTLRRTRKFLLRFVSAVENNRSSCKSLKMLCNMRRTSGGGGFASIGDEGDWRPWSICN